MGLFFELQSESFLGRKVGSDSFRNILSNQTQKRIPRPISFQSLCHLCGPCASTSSRFNLFGSLKSLNSLKGLSQVQPWTVGPERFEAVELSCLFIEQVDYDRAVVEDNPATVVRAIDIHPAVVEFRFNPSLDVVAHGSQLTRASAGRDDEIIEQSRQSGHVDGHEVSPPVFGRDSSSNLCELQTFFGSSTKARCARDLIFCDLLFPGQNSFLFCCKKSFARYFRARRRLYQASGPRGLSYRNRRFSSRPQRELEFGANSPTNNYLE